MIDVLIDPAGDTYHALLDLAARECETFSLVWPDHVRFLVSPEKSRIGLAQP